LEKANSAALIVTARVRRQRHAEAGRAAMHGLMPMRSMDALSRNSASCA
jgi:hypothetical protein